MEKEIDGLREGKIGMEKEIDGLRKGKIGMEKEIDGLRKGKIERKSKSDPKIRKYFSKSLSSFISWTNGIRMHFIPFFSLF